MTIPRNTNRAKQAIANAHDIRCYSLSNNFSGQPLADQPVIWGGPIVDNRYTQLIPVSPKEFLEEQLRGFRTKLTSSREGHYTIHIHDNLWYTFQA